MLPIILSAIVPVLVKAAEGLFSGSGHGQEKYAWVEGMVSEMVDATDRYIPAAFKPAMPELKNLLKSAIEAAVQKLDP
jgi:hypothetical protein